MSPKRRSKDHERRRTQEELLQSLTDSLDSLEDLVKIYDSGTFRIAKEIAVACFRVLDDEVKAVPKSRRLFTSLFSVPNERNLLPQVLFGGTQVRVQKGADDEDVPSFELTFFGATGPGAGSLPLWDPNRRPLSLLEYRSEIALIEGAAGRSFSVPTARKDQIPFPKRRKISRWRLLERYRSEVAAHTDSDVSSDLHFATMWEEHYPVHLTGQGRSWDSNDPKLRVLKNTWAHAFVRTVAAELIDSRKHLLVSRSC